MNFGDEITPLLLERLWGFNVTWASPDKCKLVGAGSIIEILEKKSRKNEIHIWGSGFIKDGPNNTFDNLQFHAVRGVLSKERVSGVKAIGDPGLLMSIAAPEYSNTSKKHKIGIIPHYVDAQNSFIKKLPDYINIIDALGHPLDVAKKINECEVVFSSSLHGLIVSESYGIPNYWIKLSDKLTGGNYKFSDYSSSINKNIKIIDQNLILSKSSVDELIHEYRKSQLIEQIQSDLIACFPL